MSEFVSVDRINTLKSGIESRTGETYADLTEGVQALMDGFGQGDGGNVGIPIGIFYSIITPTRQKLEAMGYAVHEFTLTSTPTSAWDLPNPLGAVPREIIALFRVDSGIAELLDTGYPLCATNTEFVNGSYTNHNTLNLKSISIPYNVPGAFTMELSSYRWLDNLPDAGKIYLRNPNDHISVGWQPGNYILAVK